MKTRPSKKTVKNITPYLFEGGNIAISRRSKPLCSVPPISKGNMPYDDGNLLLNSEEKNELILKNPEASQWLRKVVGSDEYLNGKDRWCLWLKDIDQNEINSIPLIKERVEKVREYRLDCDDESANKLAEKPHLFRETKNPNQAILIPSV